MIIDLKKLRNSGNYEENFYFEYIPSENLIDLPSAEFDSPIKVLGKVEAFKDSAYVEMDITFTVKGECSRCLSEASQTVMVEFSEEFFDDDEGDFTYKNDKLDLTKAVNDEIMMNMPMILLCKEDCRGLCYKCGKNLNDGKCDCQ